MMNKFKEDKLKTQLAAARAVIAETGKSPRELGNESRQKIIDLIYRWGFISSTVGQSYLGRTAGGYLQKQVKKSFLVATKTKSGIPAVYFTLSELGLQEAERNSVNLFKYVEIDPYKIDQLKIRHYLIAQLATIDALKSGLIVSFETERMFCEGGDKLGIKRPDVVWTTQSGLRYGVEVELSAKWERNLDFFILGIVRALHANGDAETAFNRFIIISDSAAIIKRYSAAMQPGVSLSIWEKNGRGYWAVKKTIQVPSWLINKVDFKLIEG